MNSARMQIGAAILVMSAMFSVVGCDQSLPGCPLGDEHPEFDAHLDFADVCEGGAQAAG